VHSLVYSFFMLFHNILSSERDLFNHHIRLQKARVLVNPFFFLESYLEKMNKKKKEIPITLANKDFFLFLAGQTNGGHCISEKKNE